MAAYGLYSHIQSNKRRSVVLLVGLFAMVYLMVYAGALTAEARRCICCARRGSISSPPHPMRPPAPSPGSPSPITSTSR